MRRPVDSMRLLGFLTVMALSPLVQAGGAKSLAIVADPSCRGNRLITPAEEGLTAKPMEGVKAVKVEEGKPAALVLQYFLLVREERSNVVVQLDGRVFENASGKLLAEGSATSDSFPNDEAGRQNAARQAGERLAGSISGSLSEALQAKGKGRRIVVQATLDEDIAPQRDQVAELLKGALREMSPHPKGSTDRSIVLLIQSSNSVKSLVAAIEKALGGKLKAAWVMQTESMLMLRLSRSP